MVDSRPEMKEKLHHEKILSDEEYFEEYILNSIFIDFSNIPFFKPKINSFLRYGKAIFFIKYCQKFTDYFNKPYRILEALAE